MFRFVRVCCRLNWWCWFISVCGWCGYGFILNVSVVGWDLWVVWVKFRLRLIVVLLMNRLCVCVVSLSGWLRCVNCIVRFVLRCFI